MPYYGFSPELTPQEAAAIRADTNIVIRGFRAKPGYGYVQGPVLYDSKGRIAGKQYDISDPFVVARELYKISSDERIRIANELKRVGYYGNQDISSALESGRGWTDTDEKAWVAFLNVSNNAQTVWTDMIGVLGAFPSAKGTGTTIRVTSDEDATAYAREAFFSKLGRAPSKKEISDAVDYIQAKERAAVGKGQSMPSPSATAATFAETTDPTAKSTWSLATGISLAMQALGQ
jgi:hypothetical protein